MVEFLTVVVHARCSLDERMGQRWLGRLYHYGWRALWLLGEVPFEAFDASGKRFVAIEAAIFVSSARCDRLVEGQHGVVLVGFDDENRRRPREI